MSSDVQNRVGTLHIKMCSDVQSRVGTQHIKMCSDVQNRVGTPHIKIRGGHRRFQLRDLVRWLKLGGDTAHKRSKNTSAAGVGGWLVYVGTIMPLRGSIL